MIPCPPFVLINQWQLKELPSNDEQRGVEIIPDGPQKFPPQSTRKCSVQVNGGGGLWYGFYHAGCECRHHHERTEKRRSGGKGRRYKRGSEEARSLV